MEKMVLASSNLHKLEEMRKILQGFEIELLSLWDFDMQNIEIIENGKTFEENAIIKAKFLYDKLGITAIADDSGICVDALNGAPGIYSARYCGEHGDDEKNIDKLLQNMEIYPDKKDRNARFVCAIALVGIEEKPLIFRGEVCGTLLKSRRGKGGFGYDPIFYYEPFQKSFGEAESELKNSVSHRYKALEALKQYLCKGKEKE